MMPFLRRFFTDKTRKIHLSVGASDKSNSYLSESKRTKSWKIFAISTNVNRDSVAEGVDFVITNVPSVWSQHRKLRHNFCKNWSIQHIAFILSKALDQIWTGF